MSTLLAKRFFRNWKGTDAAGNEVELAEACLCEASSLILFESKGVWLPDSASANPEQYQAPGVEIYQAAMPVTDIEASRIGYLIPK
jgi:hypothetical protein